MKKSSINTIILRSYLLLIAFIGILIMLSSFYLIDSFIIKRAQNEVAHNLKSARSVYKKEIEDIQRIFTIVRHNMDKDLMKKKIGLDYYEIVSSDAFGTAESDIVRAAAKGHGIGGTRLLSDTEVSRLPKELQERIHIEAINTPQSEALPTVASKAMVLEYALPLMDTQGKVKHVVYGGKIINRDFHLIDRIHNLVFENRSYADKPYGTVTIFQNDIRIATNVLNASGQRAIGTRVSKTVNETVLKKGLSWYDRAFVVTDWYITAYEPIRDINDTIIGILYVGILEKPFADMKKNTFFVFSVIIVITGILAFFLALFLSQNILKPLLHLNEATKHLAAGHYEHPILVESKVLELNELSHSFRDMGIQLQQRENELKKSYEQVDVLNKRYLNLIGFVSHELKGILASTILNAHALRDGFLGLVNFKQQKALESITRNLNYLENTVRNFLGLSRLENNEVPLHKADFFLREDIIDLTIETHIKSIEKKDITIENKVALHTHIAADLSLMQVAFNNLIGNAIKYVPEKGLIRFTAECVDNSIVITIFNTGEPLPSDATGKLFKMFSRLDTPQNKAVKGTGLGLFITKGIIEKHGGTIYFEPKNDGNAFVLTLPLQPKKISTEEKHVNPA